MHRRASASFDVERHHHISNRGNQGNILRKRGFGLRQARSLEQA